MSPQIILFDIGGVLVNWDGIAPLIQLTNGRLTPEQARKFWLDSPWVRKFEAGLCGASDFASGVLEELHLSMSPDEFLKRFISWDRGPLPGAIELLGELAPKIILACLSNNNELHWRKLLQEPGFLEHFKYRFVSFEIHKVKPDPEVFEYVLARLPAPPAEILFLDDNIECVEAARKWKVQAVQTRGVAEVRALLKKLNLLA